LTGDTPAQQFKYEMLEMHEELAKLQHIYHRLQAADLHGGLAEVYKELPAMQGWVWSLVETFFSLVWLAGSSDEMDELREAWKEHLL
jgi:hypothetical protein